jgi:GTP-binding protein
MFYDQAFISVSGGKGGDGVVSFRRESMVPRGGPDGGNGGRGGDVVFIVNRHLNSLLTFQYKREFRADDGRGGRGKDQTGRSGKEFFIEVAPGTVIHDAVTNAIIGDLTRPEQQLIVARGGRGGRGNARFATASNQAPQMAENGSAGETLELRLELKLIADIGIVGLPNAGKSTLLSVLTAAKPKIGDYPFTTLQPNLGVAQVEGSRTVVLADIPGLIEGASQGAGLGHEFLRHIERTRVLIHLVSGMVEDPLKDYETIQAELAAFGHGLDVKPQVVGMSKMDLPDAQAAFDLYCTGEGACEEFRDCIAFSAVSGKNVRALLMQAVNILDKLPPIEYPEIETVIESSPEEEGFEIIREGGGFRVINSFLVKRVETTRWDLDQAVQRFQHLLDRTGVAKALEQRGIKQGDTVYLGDYELEWGENNPPA